MGEAASITSAMVKQIYSLFVCNHHSIILRGPVSNGRVSYYHLMGDRGAVLAWFFVLAGGRSSHEYDKALLPFHGSTLIQYIASRVREAAGSATLVGSPERYQDLGYPVIPDRIHSHGRSCGPLEESTPR